MYDNHQRAGRAAMARAVAAPGSLQPQDIPAYAAARLLEHGARLERDTLSVSVADLSGVKPQAGSQREDPWDAIARELLGG